MRVLHIFNELKFSGAEIMYADSSILFKKHGIEMVIVSTGALEGVYSEVFKRKGIKVYHRPLLNNTYNPIILFFYFKEILQLIHFEKIDKLYIHRSTFFWHFSLIGYLANINTTRTVHNVFKNRFFTLPKAIIERYTARNFFGLIFQTIGSSIHNNELYYYKNPSIRINNWYDNTKFYPKTSPDEKKQKRMELLIDDNCYVILSTGSCSHIKNHHDIIKALAIVNQKISCLYLHLGEGCTEEEEFLLASSLGINNNIRFLKNRNNVRDYLLAADTFVMTSLFEGLSIAAIEAMSCELPCILYNSPGLRDLIDNNDNGILIEPSYYVLAEKILFFASNPEEALQKGRKACVFVDNNFSMKKGVEQITNLYNR